jgi:hypothetical protein
MEGRNSIMKKLLSAAMLVAVCGLVHADQLQDNVGIGFGTLIFRGQDGLVQQVLAATTNGSFGNQTFAISSGTLGAQKPDSLVKNDTLRKFVAENMDNLARDMATGKGESLDTLADLMTVPAEKRGEFRTNLQTNFTKIYTSADVTHLDVIRNLEKLNG